MLLSETNFFPITPDPEAYTISDNANEVDIYGLENGKPYLVSVAPVDQTRSKLGLSQKNIVLSPGLSGQRPLTVY